MGFLLNGALSAQHSASMPPNTRDLREKNRQGFIRNNFDADISMMFIYRSGRSLTDTHFYDAARQVTPPQYFRRKEKRKRCAYFGHAVE